MADITLREVPKEVPQQFIPLRQRAEHSRAFASGIEAWDSLQHRCDDFEEQLHKALERVRYLEARNELLEIENKKINKLWQHHSAARIQCAAGLKNILDLCNAVAIRENIDGPVTVGENNADG